MEATTRAASSETEQTVVDAGFEQADRRHDRHGIATTMATPAKTLR